MEKDRFCIHTKAKALSTGRSCIMALLSALSPKRVHVPHYTCDALLEPLIEESIEPQFYSLDSRLFPKYLPVLRQGEYFLYINYFGHCDQHVQQLQKIYGARLLVDDTHAFFHGQREGLWSFTSARKHIGVPDGAYLYSPVPLGIKPPRLKNVCTDHLTLRKADRQVEAFKAFQSYEKNLDTRILSMSNFSQTRLACVNYAKIAEVRRENYRTLHRALASSNSIKFTLGNAIPFCYPYLSSGKINHADFIEQHIYPPTLWDDVLKRKTPAWEQTLSANLLPLPIDHRYGFEDMQAILRVTAKSIK